MFLALSACLHGLALYGLFQLAVGFPKESRDVGRAVTVAAMVALMALAYWYYIWRGNGERVIAVYEKRRSRTNYALIGGVICVESILLQFIIPGLLILSQKLTGWPPKP
jgi:hypothetical protein